MSNCFDLSQYIRIRQIISLNMSVLADLYFRYQIILRNIGMIYKVIHNLKGVWKSKNLEVFLKITDMLDAVIPYQSAYF